VDDGPRRRSADEPAADAGAWPA